MELIIRGVASLIQVFAIMKKYLWLLVPLLFCDVLSVYFSTTEPRNDTLDLVGNHDWMASSWAIVGVVTTALGGIVLAIHDLFDWAEKRRQDKLLRK